MIIKTLKYSCFVAAAILTLSPGKDAINGIVFISLLGIFMELMDIQNELKK